ncbi:response regulator, partial [Myxococcota bacterium]|nr:response regulator [Myxococcota bacterium]
AFTLTIPMIHADASVNPAREEKPCEPQLPEGFTGKPRILIIEDNAVAALQLTTVLTGNGFEPITATDGEEALRSIEQNIPHGIILDLMIPKIDGFQVLNRIRSTPKTAHLPVLVLTAKDITRAEFAELTSNNICQLIQKGQINREQLLASIRRMIGIETATTVDKTSPVAVAPVPRTAVTSPHPTVMIVEDNPDNLAVTRAILHDMDITITVARDGKSAVEMAQRERPQIILMDINLPVMSGLEATQRIRQDPQLQDTVIIALTARAMMGDREAILAVGCDDYLSKPVEPGTLRATLARWTGGES